MSQYEILLSKVEVCGVGNSEIDFILIAEPTDGASVCQVDDSTLSESTVSAIEDSLKSNLEAGGKYGYPLPFVKITIANVTCKSAIPSGLSVRLAVSSAFSELVHLGDFQVFGRE